MVALAAADQQCSGAQVSVRKAESVRIRQEKNKILLFAEDMIFYVENVKEFTKHEKFHTLTVVSGRVSTGNRWQLQCSLMTAKVWAGQRDTSEDDQTPRASNSQGPSGLGKQEWEAEAGANFSFSWSFRREVFVSGEEHSHCLPPAWKRRCWDVKTQFTLFIYFFIF